MKSIDLHIHTHKTISDADFTFDINVLEDYVKTANLNVIAITNHNYFNKTEFEQIKDKLDIVVFPGVEVNLDGGHILVICPIEKIDAFADECDTLNGLINTAEDNIDYNAFINTFPNYEDYLLIPHYDKKPRIKKSILELLKDEIIVGEVQSYNKFILTKKDESMLI
ncbi:MAG: PHP domain-containing protein [Bacilli bacterium]